MMVINLIINFILIFLAAFYNSVMDMVDHHFSTSIFSKIKSKKWRLWFNENQGWRNKYVDRDPKKARVKWNILGFKFNKPVQLSDSWHFFKMLMIFTICMISSYNLVTFDIMLFNGPKILNLLTYWVIFGTTWNVTFYRMFYNGIFKKK